MQQFCFYQGDHQKGHQLFVILHANTYLEVESSFKEKFGFDWYKKLKMTNNLKVHDAFNNVNNTPLHQ